MSGRIFSKHFTVSEADAWLPRLRSLFAEVLGALASVDDELQILRRQTERVGGNGGGIDAPRYFSNDQTIDAALEEIRAAGIVIKDLHRGLVDFPHLMDGREVFLCWELDDDDRIGWYHELRAGYAGRRPLTR